MTEEEINKKAEKHCNEVLCNAHEKCNEVIKCRDWRSRRAGYFCGYEQALKDFEEENVELKADNDARKFAMAMSEKVEKQLREENAELKLKLEALEGQTPWKDIKDKSELIKEIADLEKENAKAKELLKEFVHHYKAKTIYIENMQDLLEQAEQFLKENSTSECIRRATHNYMG